MRSRCKACSDEARLALCIVKDFLYVDACFGGDQDPFLEPAPFPHLEAVAKKETQITLRNNRLLALSTIRLKEYLDPYLRLLSEDRQQTRRS